MSENNESKENQNRQFDEDQYKMLLRCSGKKDMTEWNEWRKANKNIQLFDPEEDYPGGVGLAKVILEGANLRKANLKGANLRGADLRGADLIKANLEGSHLLGANLKGADFTDSNLQGAKIKKAILTNAIFKSAIVDGKTLIWDCIDSEKTDFTGVGLDSARINPILKERLKGNIRKIKWQYYSRAEHVKKWRRWVRLKRLPILIFWEMFDYGRSTMRIVKLFLICVLYPAILYYVLCLIDYSWYRDFNDPGIISGLFMFKQGPVNYLNLMIRSIYFSVVTMTTLGFGDMKAYPYSNWGHICLIFQVVAGYVLLGALVTRLAILFTSSGPGQD